MEISNSILQSISVEPPEITALFRVTLTPAISDHKRKFMASVTLLTCPLYSCQVEIFHSTYPSLLELCYDVMIS